MIATIFHSLWKDKKSILIFLTIGALSAAVNIISFSILWNGLKINYQVSASIAYVLGVLFHFFANRHITFKSGNVHLMQQVPKYLVMIILNYFITITVIKLCVETLYLSPYLGIVIAIGTTVSISYWMSRLWIFQTSN